MDRVFDNIAILGTIKFLNLDPKNYNKAGMTFWFLALLFGLVLALRDLAVLRATQAKFAKRYISNLFRSADGQDPTK